jgi:hypothetical protein
VWHLKLVATFTTAARRSQLLNSFDQQYAPGTGNLDPADTRVANTFVDDAGRPSLCLIYRWAQPDIAAVKQAWINRVATLTSGTAGVITASLMIFDHNGCTNGKHFQWHAVLVEGSGVVTDAGDVDQPEPVLNPGLMRLWGGYPP